MEIHTKILSAALAIVCASPMFATLGDDDDAKLPITTNVQQIDDAQITPEMVEEARLTKLLTIKDQYIACLEKLIEVTDPSSTQIINEFALKECVEAGLFLVKSKDVWSLSKFDMEQELINKNSFLSANPNLIEADAENRNLLLMFNRVAKISGACPRDG